MVLSSLCKMRQTGSYDTAVPLRLTVRYSVLSHERGTAQVPSFVHSKFEFAESLSFVDGLTASPLHTKVTHSHTPRGPSQLGNPRRPYFDFGPESNSNASTRWTRSCLSYVVRPFQSMRRRSDSRGTVRGEQRVSYVSEQRRFAAMSTHFDKDPGR